jgi:two-component sensor histidine kinase
MKNPVGVVEGRSKLDLLDDIRRLALEGDDLGDIVRGVLDRLTAGAGGRRAAILPSIANGWSVGSVANDQEGARESVEGWAEFPIEGDGMPYGRLRVERAGEELTPDERSFACVAAGLLTAAFIRLDKGRPARLGGRSDLAGERTAPREEFIHRIRNILSVLRVIARRTADRAASIDDYAAQLDSRISALARVQSAMIADPDGSIDLGTLIDDEMVAQAIHESRMKARGPRVPLKAKAAATLGLTVHELTDNAIKYGALSSKEGRIDIVWWIDDAVRPRQLRLEWIESGVSILSTAPRPTGFGHELIEQTLQYELAAQTCLDFRPGGFRCELAIPLSDRVSPGNDKVRA